MGESINFSPMNPAGYGKPELKYCVNMGYAHRYQRSCLIHL
jgi:hypothetical protein